MEWFLATVAAALIWSATGVAAKELMDHSSSLVYSFLYSSLALLFYTPVFLYFLPRASLQLNYLLLAAVAVSGAANVFGIMSYNYSIKFGELSRVIPFTRLTPVFTALIAAAFLGEKLTPTRGLGIVLVTAGSYAVLEEKGRSWKQPLRSFIRSSAPKYAALSALIYSVASVADRYVTQQVPPEIHTFVIYFIITSTLTAYLLTRRRELVPEIREQFSGNKAFYLLTGAGAAAATYLIFYAFSRAAASRVIPVLQVQVLISVIAGHVIFDEKHWKEKIVGSAILIAGVILVAI